WVDDIPDLELASLGAPASDTFLGIANGRHCACGCGFTLAGCRRFDSECDKRGPRARARVDSVRAGQIANAEGVPGRTAGAPHASLRRLNQGDYPPRPSPQLTHPGASRTRSVSTSTDRRNAMAWKDLTPKTFASIRELNGISARTQEEHYE